MAMMPCERCMENRWRFLFNEGVVTATCQHCEREVSFTSQKYKRKCAKRAIPAAEDPRCVPFNLHDRYVPWASGEFRDPNALPWD